MGIVLHQFIRSHFNEKVRWALDYKGIAHSRTTHLPGPHMAAIRRLSGQSQTPVLDLDGDIVSGSAAIIDRLEASHPLPALYPSDPAVRSSALAFAEHLDEKVGPAVRTVIFSVLIDDGGYLSEVFGDVKPGWKRAGYRATLPLVRGMIAKRNGTDDTANIEAAFSLTRSTLDDIATRVADTGHVVGAQFSVADLTAAALVAPIANVEHADMALPSPRPKAVTELLERFAPHPATGWVREIYAKFR